MDLGFVLGLLFIALISLIAYLFIKWAMYNEKLDKAIYLANQEAMMAQLKRKNHD